MKKIIAIFLTFCMTISFINVKEIKAHDANTFVTTISSEIFSLDYLNSAYSNDQKVLANLVDGLLEYNQYGNIVGALAKSYTSNEDATVWTFHLRQGVSWVNSNGEIIGEVSAEDFVNGLRYAAELFSDSIWLVETSIKNLSAYLWEDISWDEVGIKAIDKYTVEYTLDYSIPYFHTYTTNLIMSPIYKPFLEEQGPGCDLSNFDKETCLFGNASDISSIAYNGPYVLSKLDYSKIELVKNDKYWDKDNVFVNDVIFVNNYDGDMYDEINGFENNLYSTAILNPHFENINDYLESYDGKYFVENNNNITYNINFNFNRQSYNYTSHETEDDRINTKEAILSKNFRLALLSAFDRGEYNEATNSKVIAEKMIRNIFGSPSIVVNSKGEDYGTMVEKAYKELTGNEIQLDDGQDPFFSSTKAMEYIELAKNEGIKFPVTLDVPVLNTASQMNQVNILKNSVENSTNGNILINIIQLDSSTYLNIVYYLMDPELADYDLNIINGWGADFPDPSNFLNIYSTSSGYYLTSLGLHNDYNENESDRYAKDKSGLAQFESLYNYADSIIDLDKRYEAFAKVDAYFIANALTIPYRNGGSNIVVSKIVPFTQVMAPNGTNVYRLKYMKLQNNVVTVEQYDKAKVEWENNKNQSSENVLYGDVNHDGKVNAQDRLIITRYVARWVGYDEIDMKAADVNMDGKINAQDRLIITRHVAKWIGYDLPYKK